MNQSNQHPLKIRNKYASQLSQIKLKMQKRIQRRQRAIRNLTSGKLQAAVIHARQMLMLSLSVWKDFLDNPQFQDEFEDKFFYRTTRIKQNIQHLLDTVIMSHILFISKKRQDAIAILENFQIPQPPIIPYKQPITIKDKIQINQQHQIYSKTCALILTLIKLAKKQKLESICTNFFEMYLDYLKKYYGTIEYSTGLFQYGNHLYELKMYQQASEAYDKCLKIRQVNSINGSLIDVLVNQAICLRNLNTHVKAIQYMKLAIVIYQDINFKISDKFHLFLAKLLLQNAQFEQAYHHFLIVYKYRENYEFHDQRKIQIELNFLFLNATLKDVIFHPQIMLNYNQKSIRAQKTAQAEKISQIFAKTLGNRAQFYKYKEFTQQKAAHLNLKISQQFFSLLTFQQVSELNTLVEKLQDLSFIRGLSELMKCSFYIQLKTKILLLQSNPSILHSKMKMN